MTDTPDSGGDDGLPTIAQLCDRLNAAWDAMGAYVAEVNAGPHPPKASRDGIWTSARMARLKEFQTRISGLERLLAVHPDGDKVQRTEGPTIGARKVKRKATGLSTAAEFTHRISGVPNSRILSVSRQLIVNDDIELAVLLEQGRRRSRLEGT